MISASNASDIVVKKEVLRLPFSIVFFVCVSLFACLFGERSRFVRESGFFFYLQITFLLNISNSLKIFSLIYYHPKCIQQ